MRKIFVVLAIIISGAALVLAYDPWRFAFRYADAGGHTLRMLISGQGSPTVVFETGGSGAAGGPLEAWKLVQPDVSKFAAAVAYDRAGIGLSVRGPKPRDARQIAIELHKALSNAHVAPPYILVGHSFGGPLIRVFAGIYPHEVAGMVLVDPTQEEFIDWNQARNKNREPRQDEEWKDIQASLAEAHESPVPQGARVTLITAMGPRVFPAFVTEKDKEEFRTFKPVWLKYHNAWLATIPNAKHIVTEDSGHVVPFEQPGLVVDAIRQMVDEVRSGK